jgi:hypothetical protein
MTSESRRGFPRSRSGFTRSLETLPRKPACFPPQEIKYDISQKSSYPWSHKDVALEQGADLVGVVSARDLAEHEEGIARILPSAKSIVVVAARHSLAAIRSSNNQVAQFDTIHTYG